MIAESGHFALILAFCVACVQASMLLLSARMKQETAGPPLMRLATVTRSAALVQFALLLWAFMALTIGFIQSDFSLQIVAANSHAAKPLLYKVAGVWGNHEGSMLLWNLILSAYGAGFALWGGLLSTLFKLRTLAVQALLGVAFLAFSLFTSNPFARLFPPPFEGMGLNPILQDPALALHPPVLYLGYVGFSIVFSFAMAMLISRQIEAHWARALRVWILPPWICLTLGIALGSFWAYYELGWGGFWFWDPVENASLMPWLCGTALLHSAFIGTRRASLHRWTILLSILTFGLSIAGTFLVRSGVLASVHAFANDPARGVFVLIILALVIGGALILYARAAPMLTPPTQIHVQAPHHFAPISREGAILLNNVFLASATATIFIGTIYPLAIDVLGLGKISVGAPYFNIVFTPLIAPLLLIMPIAPLLGWGAGRGLNALKRLMVAFILALLTGLGVVLMQDGRWLAALGLAASAWVIFGALTDIIGRIYAGGAYLSARLWATPLAHGGVGVMLFGIISTTAWQSESITTMQLGDQITIANYQVRLTDIMSLNGANYRAERGVFAIHHKGKNLAPLLAERRFYPVEQTQTTEAAILKKLSGHLYIALGETLTDKPAPIMGGVTPNESTPNESNNAPEQQNNKPYYVVRIWHHPFVAFIWIGACFMAAGGVASLLSRVGRKRPDSPNYESS